MIFCLRKKTQFERKYPSVNIQGNFERGGLMIFILAWLNGNPRLVKWPSTLHTGRGRESSYQLWKGNHWIQTPNLPTPISFFFFPRAQKLSRSSACWYRGVPAWEQTDWPIPATCLAMCQRAHGGICVLKGGKAQAETWVHLITTLSPAMLKLALHIRLRTRRFPKKGMERLRYPCIFCLLQKTDDKHNDLFKAVLLGGGVGNRDRAGCGTQQRREMAF